MTSRSEYQRVIDSFFLKSTFTKEEVRKIKNLAMKNRIRLGKYRRFFCSNCLNQLKGKISISKSYKSVICTHCGKRNRFKIN